MSRAFQQICWVAAVSLLFSTPLLAQKKQKPPATAVKKKPAKPQAQAAQPAAATPAPQAESQAPKRTYTDKPRLREQWFYEQRAFPRKQIPAGAHARAIARLEEMRRAERDRRSRLSTAQAIMASETMWTNIGPQPSDSGGNVGFTSGRIGAIAVDPTDPNIVYLGGAQGGVWKTTNGGVSWIPLTDSQASLAVGAIAIDTSSSSCGASGPCQTIYVGTGEQTFSSVSYYGAGVLKSTDGGMTWAQLGNPPGAPFVGPFNAGVGGARISSLVVNPTNPNVLLAGVQIFVSVDTGSSSGIYRSNDGGVTWTNVLAGAVGTEVFFDPSNPMVAYAALGTIFILNSNSQPVADPDNGIYRSANMGVTWTRISGTGLPTTNLGRIELAVAPSNPNVLYASIANASLFSDDLLGVFRSTDGGTTWTTTNAPNYCAGQCWYDHVIRVHPNNAAVVYAGGSGIGSSTGSFFVRTTNGTSGSPTWAGIGLGGNGQRIHVDVHALAFSFNGPQVVRLYNGNDGGVWSADVSSPTGPITWTNLNDSLSLTQHYPALSIHPSNENISIVGSQDNDTHRYSGSLQWQQIGPGCDGGWTVIDQGVPSTWFITCQFINILRSVQNGDPPTFDFVDNEIFASGDPVAFIAPLVADPTLSNRLYFGTNRVWQTTNSGDFWQAISPDLTGGGGTLRAIAVAHGNSDVVYAGSGAGAIQRTLMAGMGTGAAWDNVTRPELPARAVTQVAINPGNPSDVYATFSGFGSCPAFGGSPACDGKGHVFRTTNGGASWTDISIAPFSTTPLPDSPVNDIVVDPLDPTGNTLYVGTDVGVFFTTDGGANWATLVTGLPRVAVFSLRLQRASRILRAATHGRGTWDLQLPGLLPFHLRSISPVTAPAGSADLPMTLVGDGFSPASVVQFGAVQLTPSLITSTQLTVTIPAAQMGSAQVAMVSVFDPNQAPNTTTAALPFTVTGPAPTLSSISPTTVPEGSGDTQITALGANFTSGISFLRFDGVDLPTTVDSSSQLRATVPASMLTTGRLFSVQVFNAPPGGGARPTFPDSPIFFTVVGPPPPNDNFANAIVVTGNTFSDTQNNVSATVEATDPAPSCVAGLGAVNNGRDKSIWYRFTAPARGTVFAATFGSSYDTILSVFTGGPPGAFTQVACHDDIVPGQVTESFVLFDVTPGVTYFLMISAFRGDGGQTTFNFLFAETPPNDDFFNATVVGPAPFSNGVISLGATTESTDPTPVCASGSGAANNGRAKSIWYRFTASAAGNITADTLNSFSASILSVWTGNRGALTSVACNLDPNGGQSQVTFSAIANTTYHFMVTDFFGFGDEIVFNVTAAPAPAPDISLSSAQGTLTVTRGQSASTMISVSAFAGFSGSVTLACSGAPSLATCVANPASVTPGAMPASSTLTITTTAGSTASSIAARPGAPLPVLAWLAAFALGLGFLLAARRSNRLRFAGGVALVFVLLLLALQVACGGGGDGGGGNPPAPQPGTPPGTFTLTVTGTSGTLSRSTTLTLTVN